MEVTKWRPGEKEIVALAEGGYSLLDKATGEEGPLITAESPAAQIAALYEYLEGLREELALAQREVQQWILDKMDSSLEWTISAGDVKLSAPSPEASTSYRAAELSVLLDRWRDEGVISAEAYAKCWRVKTPAPVTEVAMAGIDALLKTLPAERAQELRDLRTERRTRRLTVKRSRGW